MLTADITTEAIQSQIARLLCQRKAYPEDFEDADGCDDCDYTGNACGDASCNCTECYCPSCHGGKPRLSDDALARMGITRERAEELKLSPTSRGYLCRERYPVEQVVAKGREPEVAYARWCDACQRAIPLLLKLDAIARVEPAGGGAEYAQ